MTSEGGMLDALSKAWLENEGKRYGHHFSDPEQAQGLGAKLFGWIKAGFGKDYTENGDIFIPRAFVDAFGERAPGIVESAITAARKEGWNVGYAGEAVKAVREYVTSNEGDVGFLKGALRYSQEKNWSDKTVSRFAKELRTSNGQLGKEDYKWLKSQVVAPVAVLEHFQKPSRFYKAEKKLGVKADASLTKGVLDQDEKSGITDNDGDWGSGVNEGEAQSTRHYPTLSEGEFFDIRDPAQRESLEKKGLAAKATNASGTVNKVIHVGIVDRTLEKIAEEKGVDPSSLPKQTRDKVMRDLVHEYFPNFERLSPPPKNVSELTTKLYEERKADYERGLTRRANLLNQKIVALAVDRVGMEKLGTQIEAREVHMKNADVRKPNYGAHKGNIIFRTYNKEGKVASRPFLTSTQMILSKMFKAKDSNGASTKRYEGTAQQLLQMLNDGITSILQDKRFGGENKPMKIGTLSNGEARWFDGADIRKWPKDLVIFRDKEGNGYTLGEALEQEKLQSQNTLSFDFDIEDKFSGRVDRVKDKKVWEMRDELKTLLIPETGKDVRGRIVMALRRKDDEEVAELWSELREKGVLKSSGEVVEVGTTRGDTVQEGQVGTGTMADYDPDYIKRDERGNMLSSSTEYTAQSFIGTSKKVDPKDAAKFAPATKTTPDRTEGKVKLTELEAARQEFVELIRHGVDAFKTAVEQFSREKVKMFATANTEFKTQIDSEFPHAVAKGYFAGDVNKARMFVARLRKNLGVVDATIDARLKETENELEQGQRGDKKALGEGRQANPGRKEAGVVAQPGRERTTENSELGSGKQGRDTKDGELSNGKVSSNKSLAQKSSGTEPDTQRGAGSGREVGGGRNERSEAASATVQGAPTTGLPEWSAEVSGRGERRVSERELPSVQIKSSQQLQTYLDQHGSKNAFWANSVRQALSSEDSKRIDAALAAAKKQFGELKVEAPKVAAPAKPATSKEDTWVMKVAFMSTKDMKEYVKNIPSAKLERAFELLDTYFPADNRNPFWQRNNLDNHTDKNSAVVSEAQDLIRDRLSETKYSEQTTGEANGQPEGQNNQA